MKAAISPWTLDDAPIGAEVRVVALGALAPEHRDRLQSYGVRPDHYVRVLQHRTVTIVQVEQAELALETTIARAVRIVRPDLRTIQNTPSPGGEGVEAAVP